MIHGISYWSMKQGGSGLHPIKDALRDARSAGFAGLELAIGQTGVLTVDTSQAECRDIRKTIDASGVVVETLASGMSWAVCPTHPDPTIRREAVELHKAAIQRAAWLGCEALLFVPGAVLIPWQPDFPGQRYDLAVKWARQAVGQLAGTAERWKVTLCVENVWNGLFYSPVEYRDFLASFGSSRVKAYFDVGNVLGYHQHPHHWIEILNKQIGRIHIKDFKRTVGNLSGFCDLGEGDVPWPEVAKALKKVGYRKTVVAEMMPWKKGLLTRTSQAMKKLLPE